MMKRHPQRSLVEIQAGHRIRAALHFAVVDPDASPHTVEAMLVLARAILRGFCYEAGEMPGWRDAIRLVSRWDDEASARELCWSIGEIQAALPLPPHECPGLSLAKQLLDTAARAAWERSGLEDR